MTVSLVVMTIVFLSRADGYGRGAPYSTCITQFPQHDAVAQTDPSPFSLQVSANSYGPNEHIEVTIVGLEFVGFSLTARRLKGNTEEILGSFVNFSSQHAQAVNCMGGDKNYMTHVSPQKKSNTTFTWTIGSATAGDVIFRATILKTESIFWVGVTSPHIQDLSNSGNLGTLPMVEDVFPEMNLEKDCGNTKGCFLNPKTCTGSDCTYALSYQLDGDVIHFEMMGVAEGYVSVGFSEDDIMGDDDVVACTVQDSVVSVQHGLNVGYTYIRQYTDKLMNMATAKKDGKIYCRFSRPKSLASMKVEEEDDPSGPTELTIDLSSGKVIFIAVGKTYNGGNDLAEHVEAPVLSSGKVDFSQFKVARGTTMTLLTQLHGVAMVLAWMLFVSFATVEGRYFREGFGSKMVCGLKLWFQMHRVVTMIAGILTAAGFILIFVKVKGLSKNAQAHTYIGIIVMAATCGQIFLGLIRPDATAGWRPKFNWAHRLLGKATHILAAADLILAFRLPMVSPEMRHFGTTVVAVWISVQVVWEVTFEVNKYLQSKSPKVDSIPGKEETKIEEKVIWKDPNGRLQLILCILFVLTIVSCSVATLCAILIF